MGRTLGTLLTMTTYGTWLRGDARGWVENGVVYPPDPGRELCDHARLKHPPFRFSPNVTLDVGSMIGESLIQRTGVAILALTVQPWHVHFVIGPTNRDVADVVKCAKDAVRWGLQPGRPIWTDGYDKRFCFDVRSLERRIAYVERHNVQSALPARPWSFIAEPVPWAR